ncbi:hypothetical protein FOE78_05175 [Microlunatus elymi]|uniref:Uncharacterized protein n=1 Tax=Microlunatus elymi TaxID=2596828 RepID=A0A516PW26_9ACTN|nr:hypothetical protein [Microlunatus elymi]QDP95388.1 hypothetical protein FOE78_05175 [Microlunatus elymi]
MWLNLEAGAGKDLNRRYEAHFAVPDHHLGPGHGPKALIVEAANSILPEAGIEDLPALARAELAAGRSGPLREAIADCHESDPHLRELRDRLVRHFGGRADSVGAITLTDHVYLGRLEHDAVPPAITAACISWYGHWRAACSGPSLPMAETMAELLQRWQRHPAQRSSIDHQIRQVTRHIAAGQFRDLIATTV